MVKLSLLWSVQKAHLAMIDALMTLAAKETVGRVKMAAEAEQMGVGAPWENALLFWVNRVRPQNHGNNADVTLNSYLIKGQVHCFSFKTSFKFIYQHFSPWLFLMFKNQDKSYFSKLVSKSRENYIFLVQY